jgi:hypothetical protein
MTTNIELSKIFSSNIPSTGTTKGVTYVNSGCITMRKGKGISEGSKQINCRSKLKALEYIPILESLQTEAFADYEPGDCYYYIIFLRTPRKETKALIICEDDTIDVCGVLIEFDIDTKQLGGNQELTIQFINDIISPFEFICTDEYGFIVEPAVMAEFIFGLIKTE